jgi:glycerol-1-phosphate dehydrogenase [NAD(P)+]
MSNSIKISPDDELLFSIGHETIPELIKYLQEKNVVNIVLVSDDNEYEALGARVEKALCEADFDVSNIVLHGDDIGANEEYIVQTLLPANDSEQLYIAVGSGTVTDIVRFVSYRAKSFFISLPTAPSVDGFASNGSAMFIKNYKQTIISRRPYAIFADLETLCNAPKPLIAAGFGDMIGKFTALADWHLAHLVNGDRYDAAVAERSRNAVEKVVAQISSLETDRETSTKAVMEALYEEGLCMLDFGNSRPASGAEHQLSHFWEMKLLREDRPAVFHGSKVGLASIWVAKYFEMIREMSKEEAIKRLETVPMFDVEVEKQKIKRGYGEKISDFIETTQEIHLSTTGERYNSLKTNIIKHWDTLQEIAREVPSSEEIEAMLKAVGGATQPEDIGLTEADLKEAIECAQYVRKAFTILNVSQMLGWKPTV